METLLSGAYVGVDPPSGGASQFQFEGLDSPPIVTSDTPGNQFVLHAADLESLDVGSPVYFRRIQVGQVLGKALRSADRMLIAADRATSQLDNDGRHEYDTSIGE
ncbi:hypothetical protein ACU4GI_47380 (plasmid) [Cupriavidus basilensis]